MTTLSKHVAIISALLLLQVPFTKGLKTSGAIVVNAPPKPGSFIF